MDYPYPPHSQTLAEALAAMPIFKDVEPSLLHGFSVSGRLASVKKGELLLAGDQLISRFFIILNGWCGLGKSNAAGKEAILQLATQGDLLPGLENTAISAYAVQALTPVKVLMLPPNILHNTLRQSPAFMANMVAYTARRNRELCDHIAQLTLSSAEERVGHFLLGMRIKDGAEKHVVLPFDKTAIAAYLGIKPETFSRALAYFKQRGFSITNRRVDMPVRESLCQYCTVTLAAGCPQAELPGCTPGSAELPLKNSGN